MKQCKPKSIINKLEEQQNQNKYLIELALAQGEFKSKDDLEEWYKCACFAKTLNPKYSDETLMPQSLKKIMLRDGLITTDDYYVYTTKA